MADKEIYEKKLQAQLDEWKAEMEKLQAKARGASADAQAEYDEQVKKLRAHRDEMAQQMKKLNDASGDAWEDVRKGVDSAWDSMSEAMKSAWNRFT